MTSIDYDGRRFRSVGNSPGGDVDGDTTFLYRQRGAVVRGDYSGGSVAHGALVALVADDGSLDMRYTHATTDGRLVAGRCRSQLEILADGRYRLHETWEWTDGAEGTGTSVIEEIALRTERPVAS